ncbi:MAG: hypothetical protein P8Z41_12165 [Anaerolineales bacterium]
MRHQWTQVNPALLIEPDFIQPLEPANVDQRRDVRPLAALHFQQ